MAIGLLALGDSAAAAATPVTAESAVGFDQHLGTPLPLDITLRDDAGRATRLRDALNSRPSVLIFGYSRCPQLCSVVSNAVVETLRRLQATAGRDFNVLYVSIDPTDTTRDLAAMKRRDVGHYGRAGVAPDWRYLSGSEDDIRQLTRAAGFRYTYDSRQKLYAHASGFLVLTPDGRVSQYFLGVDFNAKDVATALERAAAGKIGTTVFQLLLLCARGAMIAGKYGRIIWISLEIAVIATVLALFGGIAWMLAQERRRNTRVRGIDVGGATPPRIDQPDPEVQT